MNKIFVWCYEVPEWGRGHVASHAMTEDGRGVAGHVSSSIGWAHQDMIGSGWKDDAYKSAYPDGYEVVWLGDDPESSAEWRAAFALNKAMAEAKP